MASVALESEVPATSTASVVNADIVQGKSLNMEPSFATFRDAPGLAGGGVWSLDRLEVALGLSVRWRQCDGGVPL